MTACANCGMLLNVAPPEGDSEIFCTPCGIAGLPKCDLCGRQELACNLLTDDLTDERLCPYCVRDLWEQCVGAEVAR